MSGGIGALGLKHRTPAPSPSGLSPSSGKIDRELLAAEDMLDCIRVDVNRLRLFIEDMAQDVTNGIALDERDVRRARRIAFGLANACESGMSSVQAARKVICKKARRARRREAQGQTMPAPSGVN
jgi:hypothetical protein